MSAVAGLVAGVIVALGLQRGLAPVYEQPLLARTNHRGVRLPTAAGLILVLAVLVVEGARVVVHLLGSARSVTPVPSLLMVTAVAGFGALGLVDDLLGDDRDKGLRGHLAALGRGRLTTGAVKLAAGAALALVLAGAIDGDRPGRVLVDGALIALAANLANLFDRAPGRTLKVGLAAYVPLAVAAGAGATGSALAVVIGGTLALLPADLRERSMLGDTGANALGAALGLATVLLAPPGGRLAVVIVLAALTGASEVVSFSRVIAATPPLRAIDLLGRPRPGPGA